MPRRDRPAVALELPWRTIGKVLATAALVWVWWRTWQLFLIVVVAVLLAVTLDPVVRWLERRGLPRWGASAVVALAAAGIVAGFLAFAVTSLPAQGRLVTARMVDAEHELVQRIPPGLRAAAGAGQPGQLAQGVVEPLLLRVTSGVGRALLVMALAFVLTVYLLIEGGRTYRWLLAFVPPSQRDKVNETAVASQRVIFGYVAGNVATSIFATVFVAVALSLLHVPAALLLGILAGLCDFVPVLGFIVSAIPAILLALAVSPLVALSVVALYVAYHTLENYLIAPWVYGERLRLSNLAVILAFAVGASLAGIVGALIALPIAAAYPAVERIWLIDRLGPRVVREHGAIQTNG